MKNLLTVLILSLILINSCAKPTVVNVVMPGDKKLNCEELKDGFFETRRFKQEAESIKEVNTGGNVTRGMFFWPALLKTLANADEAIKAANDRGYHLVGIMKNKNCKDTDKLFAELTKTTSSYITQEIIRLNQLYKSGVLTKEEFIQAKKKVLNQ